MYDLYKPLVKLDVIWLMNTRGWHWGYNKMSQKNHVPIECNLCERAFCEGLLVKPSSQELPLWTLLVEYSIYCTDDPCACVCPFLNQELGVFLLNTLHIKLKPCGKQFFMLKTCGLCFLETILVALGHSYMTVLVLTFIDFCHATLCWTWFWWWSAVSTVVQFPVVGPVWCQCHSGTPCSMLSVVLCQKTGC